jgi:DinB family protein
MSMQTELAALYRRDLTRVVQQLQAFPEGPALWQLAPGVTNSAGNLVLHLEGNLREFIGRLLGDTPYQRRREQEFAAKNVSAAELIERMEGVVELIPRVVASLSDEVLAAPYPSQVVGGYASTQQFVLALLAHLSYHLGQIDYLRRFLTQGGAIDYATL